MSVQMVQTPESGQLETSARPEEIARRKAFLEFGDADERLLEELNQLAQDYADAVIEDLYRHFLSFEETRTFFRDPQVLDRVKLMQKEYFLRLTQGDYNTAYIQNRLNVGQVHERIGLEVKWYLGAYNFYLRATGQRIFEAYANDPTGAVARLFALMKLVFLDIGLAIDNYINQRERTARTLQEAIKELSTPVLQLHERLLLLPIIGAIDSQRARQLTEGLLRAIRAHRAKVVVMDITGVASVDSGVANHLMQTVEASRLMGATTIVTGVSPEIAQTLVTLGLDLTKIHTVGDLQGGIDEAYRLLSYRVVVAGEEQPSPNGTVVAS